MVTGEYLETKAVNTDVAAATSAASAISLSADRTVNPAGTTTSKNLAERKLISPDIDPLL